MTDTNIPAVQLSEHDVTRVMSGNIESVRQRLALALEQMGYRVLSENPLQARHAPRGAGLMSANVLDYKTNLEINLKPQGPGATQLNFYYQVQHGYLGKGDFRTLTREAEAVIALALQQSEARHCPGCGIEVLADSRFCRKCGTPVVVKAPAELELMHTTAGARAGYQWIWTGIFVTLFGLLFPLIGLVKGNPPGVLFGFAAFFAALGAWGLGAGLRRLHLTLNPKIENEETRLPNYSPAPVAAQITDELPVQYSSITEGTTNLLPEIPASDSREREKIPS
jgi:hypothetical protein